MEQINLNFRKATGKDADLVHQLIEELESQSINKNSFLKSYEQNLNSDSVFYFIVEDLSGPVGFVSLHFQNLLHHFGMVAEIQELVLLAASRNKGYGKMILDKMIALAKLHHCVLIELAANKKRIDAHRFYTQAGWKQSHFKFTLDLT